MDGRREGPIDHRHIPSWRMEETSKRRLYPLYGKGEKGKKFVMTIHRVPSGGLFCLMVARLYEKLCLWRCHLIASCLPGWLRETFFGFYGIDSALGLNCIPFVPFQPIPSHPISSYTIPFLTSTYFRIPSHPIPSHPILHHSNTFLTSTHQFIPLHPLPSLPIPSHSFPSNPLYSKARL